MSAAVLPAGASAATASAAPHASVYEDVDDGADEAAIAAMLDGGARNGHGDNGKLSRGQRKRAKQKQKKHAPGDEAHRADAHTHADTRATGQSHASAAATDGLEIEYVIPDITQQIDTSNPELAQFIEVFQRFNRVGAPAGASTHTQTQTATHTPEQAGEAAGESADAEVEVEQDGNKAADGNEEPKLSRRQRKAMLQFGVAALKQEASRPEVVEAHDVTSSDPKLLVHLKASRNTVPVPRHWCHKRKYLAGKRGFDKPPFELPAFIAATGITKLRGADLEAQADKTLKAKQRDRYIPKMGRIEIEYEVLHDAFFKHQTKPRLSRFGDLYYEGKELETNFAETKKPGVISERLRTALGVADGAPPPWLINMQRYGPPPSYPNLRIPGVNAPLPPGATYGTHPGGWGRPPVDEYGRPLYGDVFGTMTEAAADAALGTGAVKQLWGEIREHEEGAVAPSAAGLEQEEEMMAAGAAGEEGEGAVPPPPPPPLPSAAAMASGVMTPVDGAVSVQRSLLSGMETPDVLQLRKGAREGGMETPDTTAGPVPELYRVLEERKTGLQGGLLATTHTYVVPPAGAATKAAGAAASGASGVAIALAPEDLEKLDEGTLAKKYEDELRHNAETAAASKEDISDLLEEQERKRRRKEAATASGAGKKKARTEYKF